jgi:hypothetical protein
MLFNKLALISFMVLYINSKPLPIEKSVNPSSLSLVTVNGDGTVSDGAMAQAQAAGTGPNANGAPAQSGATIDGKTNNNNANAATTNNAADKKAAKQAEIKAEIQKFKEAAAQGNLKQAVEEEVKAEIQKAKDAKKLKAAAADANSNNTGTNTGATDIANSNIAADVTTVNTDGSITNGQPVKAAVGGLS